MKDFAPKSIGKFTLEESGGMTSTAVEQATLGQYFTQRKGLEDVHPAKRRKVDTSGVEGEVAVRRSERSKKQAASFQSKISTRSSKASKRNAKVILKEKSVQTPAKERSDSTSLFDDHAFAEALIGKLTDAQRKRKIVASSRQRDDAITSAPKENSSEEGLQGQINESENESRPKIRRRIAKYSKTTERSINGEKSTDLDAAELVNCNPSQSKEESSSDGKSFGMNAPEEKATMVSPLKTPPVVRRVGSGLKADPWIAEQAKMVHSRGRAAVNLSQRRRGKEDVKQQAGATKKSCSVENSKVSMKKAQEDLAKARKLIRSMRSLEKSVPKSSLSCTEDKGLRLHQMAKKNNDTEKSQSLKDAPAYQRFHALAQPTPSEASSTTLPLPYKYKVLAEMFRCTDTILNLLGQRKEKCTFTKLRDAVQQMSRKRFEKKHLAQMKTVYPGALEFHQDKCLGKSSSFELIIEFGKTEEALSKLTLTATELLARRDTFQKNLLQTTKRHHQDFLSNLSPSLSVDDNKIMRWHPKFHLDEVPDVEEGKLPQPPVVKTYSSANDVLEKARDMIAPRVEKALKAVALKEQEGEELTSANKNKNLPEKKEVTKSTEEMQSKNNLKNKAALKGISQDLLNKIRQKEAKKIEESLMRDPLVDKKLAMKERLPELCRILKAYFSAERKAAIPLEDATVKLSDSYKTSLSSVQVEEHIRFMSQLVPEWISLLTVRKCAYIKINKTADVNNVINKLITKEIQ